LNSQASATVSILLLSCGIRWALAMDRERIVVVFFFGLLAVIAYELYAVLYPFLTPIAWAILLAFLFHPALVSLNRVLPRRTTCAVIISIAVALGVILPAIWISAKLLREAQTLYGTISELSTTGGLARASQWIRATKPGAMIDASLARRGITLEDELRKFALSGAKVTSDYVIAHGSAVASNFASFIFHFAIALLTFFYLLRDGESYYEGLRELTPLHEEDKAAVFETLRVTLSSVMRGLMLTALTDGVALGLGYLVLGVPYWAFLALLTAAGGLLPIGGTAVIWVPVAIYLLIQVSWGAALALVLWAAVTLAIVDNFLKPLTMRHGTGLPTVALFFGLAGGIEAYGPLGIFAGPAIIAIFGSLLRVYRRTYVHEEGATAETARISQASAVATAQGRPRPVEKEHEG
jgi:predicted PurR-regulated permease PerM